VHASLARSGVASSMSATSPTSSGGAPQSPNSVGTRPYVCPSSSRVCCRPHALQKRLLTSACNLFDCVDLVCLYPAAAPRRGGTTASRRRRWPGALMAPTVSCRRLYCTARRRCSASGSCRHR
jgi:hypothetical protein